MEPAYKITRAFRRKERDPLELAEETLAVLRPDPALAALTPERALAAARASRERYRRGRPLGPLDGVGVLVKDLLDVAGTVTGAGSAVLARLRAPAREDAVAVANLERAGAVIIGKTQLNELAFSGLGINPHFGTPANALRREWVPGGSSSGSAVAVARGWTPLAVGTDTGGSVRIPAACNGLVGFKPSNGLVPTAGVTPLSPTLDTVGPLAANVADAWALFQVLGGLEPGRLEVKAAKKLLLPAGQLERSQPEVRRAFMEALARLEAGGLEVETEDVPELAEVYRLYRELGALAAHEALVLYRDLIATHGDEMDRRVVSRIMAAADREPLAYRRLLAERAALIPRFWRKYAAYDALALPTLPVTPPLLAEADSSDEAFFAANGRVLAHTMLFNFFSGPAISLPVAPGVGLMLAAAPGRDAALFALAAWVEGVLRR